MNGAFLHNRLVVFDFDGTLADSFALFVESFNVAAAFYRFKQFDMENVQFLRTLTATDVLKHHGVRSWMLPLIAHTIRKAMGRSMSRVRLFGGVSEMLARLHDQGVPLGLLTSNSLTNVELVLGREQLSRFRYLRCGTSLSGKSRIIGNVMKQSRLRSADLLFIGDEIRDLHAARDAGIPFLGAGWGYTDASALLKAGASSCFQSIEALTAHLLLDKS